MKRTYRIAFGIMLFVCGNASWAQDIHFSQFSETPVYINPAMSGMFNGDQRIILNYKNQWASIGAPYRTFALSFDAGLLKKHDNAHLGVGIFVFNDRAGDNEMGITQALASVSGIIKVGSGQRLSAGIQGGYAQRSLSTDNMQWGEQYNGLSYDSSLPNGEPGTFNSFGYADMAGGLAYSYVRDETNLSSNDNFKFKIGGSFSHFTRPALEFYNGADKLGFKYIGHMNLSFGIQHTNTAVQPAVFYAQQAGSREIVGGCMFRYTLREGSKYTGLIDETALSIGAYYRFNDAVMPGILLEYSNFAFGLSYDINASKLKAASNARGGIEFSLRYINPNPFKQTQSKSRI